MAVSPLPPVSQRGEHGAQPAKSSGKSLPMRSNSAGGPPTPVEVVKPKAAELAEHLNDEIRQKYVKGAPSAMAGSQLLLTNIKTRRSVKERTQMSISAI